MCRREAEGRTGMGWVLIGSVKSPTGNTLMVLLFKDPAISRSRISWKTKDRKCLVYTVKANNKVMIIDRAPTNGEVAGFEIVDEFLYLGSLVTSKGRCDKGIRRMAHITTTLYKYGSEHGDISGHQIKINRDSYISSSHLLVCNWTMNW